MSQNHEHKAGKKKKAIIWVIILLAAVIILFAVLLIKNNSSTGISTFKKTNDLLCVIDGKPVIRLYSTTTCPHCIWIKETYNSVVNDYAARGKIVAYHWLVDTGDDILTPGVEQSLPSLEQILFQRYSNGGYVPTFAFGCKYTRIGNGYERQNDLASEDAEFRAVIDELIEEAKTTGQK